ncbi:MAG: alkaline phosphatase D family protein, partial [Pseudomonadota bacterium]
FVFDAAYLRSAYLKLSAIPEFDAFRKTVPIDAIWNDRDFGLSHSGADNPGKESARDIFLKFWNVPPEDPRHSRNGVYFSRLIGAPGRRVQLIFLDTRSFRSPLRPTDERGVKGKERWLPDDNPAKTLLGDAQWAWLEAQLRQPAELRIIASGIQVLAEGHGFERWGALPRERARLLRLIDETGAGGVVFLSGDRQVAAHYRSEEARVPLYEATSSGLNRTVPSAQERGPHQLGDVYGGENFGLLTIDWVEGTVLLDVRRTDGTLVRQTGVTLAKLASGAGEPGPDPAPGGGQALPEIDNT